jgi:Cys-tRNA(Pro) deacylase
MARKKRLPVTPAIRALRAAEVSFSIHQYEYQEHGGTQSSSDALGVNEHHIVKTLVLEDEERRPLLVLMHGDCQVSVRGLARQVSCRSLRLCAPHVALKHTGYRIGGTSPFGTRKTLPVYLERSIQSLKRIYINGGKRGLLVSMLPADLIAVLTPIPVDCALS